MNYKNKRERYEEFCRKQPKSDYPKDDWRYFIDTYEDKKCKNKKA